MNLDEKTQFFPLQSCFLCTPSLMRSPPARSHISLSILLDRRDYGTCDYCPPRFHFHHKPRFHYHHDLMNHGFPHFSSHPSTVHNRHHHGRPPHMSHPHTLFDYDQHCNDNCEHDQHYIPDCDHVCGHAHCDACCGREHCNDSDHDSNDFDDCGDCEYDQHSPEYDHNKECNDFYPCHNDHCHCNYPHNNHCHNYHDPHHTHHCRSHNHHFPHHNGNRLKHFHYHKNNGKTYRNCDCVTWGGEYIKSNNQK